MANLKHGRRTAGRAHRGDTERFVEQHRTPGNTEDEHRRRDEELREHYKYTEGHWAITYRWEIQLDLINLTRQGNTNTRDQQREHKPRNPVSKNPKTQTIPKQPTNNNNKYPKHKITESQTQDHDITGFPNGDTELLNYKTSDPKDAQM